MFKASILYTVVIKLLGGELLPDFVSCNEFGGKKWETNVSMKCSYHFLKTIYPVFNHRSNEVLFLNFNFESFTDGRTQGTRYVVL